MEHGVNENVTGQKNGAENCAISGLGILTAQRPTLLERALASYIENCIRHQRQVEYVVYDDSKKLESRQASLEVARKLSRKFKVPIRFAGFEERCAYAGRLAEFPGISLKVLQNALLQTNGYTLGQNRNGLLLDSIGNLFLCVDDDTSCALKSPPVSSEELKTCVGEDPALFWCFQDFSAAISSAPPIDRDLLGAHETLLGRAVEELLSFDAQSSEMHGRSGLHAIRSPNSVVRITLNGLLGDCAWGSPFGFWHAPMGYLAFDGPSLTRLISSEEHYRQALRSRQIMRVTSGPVISDASFSMLTSWGLDNRQLLPPNVPVNRGQDLIFGYMIWQCFNKTVFGHVPLAIVHDPIPPRKFWDGELLRSASGVDICRLLIEAIGLCGFSQFQTSDREQLVTLGKHLTRLADLSGKMLGELFMERLHATNRHFVNEMTQRAARVQSDGLFYVKDIFRYCDKLKVAECRPDYWLPLDLMLGDRKDDPESRTRRVIRQLGELLIEWPRIIDATMTLREAGFRLSVPV